MTPSIDLRITTMVRAMQDVVLPAIDSANGLAREQASLVFGHLNLLAAQWSRADDYARVCLADLEQTVSGLVPAGGPLTRAAAGGVQAARAETGAAEVRYKRLMAATDALVRAADQDAEASFADALRDCLLAFTLRQSTRDRSWFAGSGFDLRPAELSRIDDIIAGRNEA